ncbi:VOC family protein [Sphingomonas oligophenolica]|uniref:VOC family protein n=1 Tax=Sphingomonas oligophenolica TaxID=301154 RepID=A0ABU9Y9M1_9SPHN
MNAPLQITPHLYFRGNAESALQFYAECGLGKIIELRRYAGTPLADREGGAWRNKVLHAVFEGPGLRLYAGDGADSEPMKGCAILIELDDVAAAKSLFARLSSGGHVTLGFAKQHWGDHYGNFTDKFGVQWAVNAAVADPSRVG